MKTTRLLPSVVHLPLVAAGVTLALLAVAATAGAQPRRAGSASGAEYQPYFLASFDQLWRDYLEAETRGSTEEAARSLEEIRRSRVERNTFNLHDVAQSFVYRGLWHLGQGDLEKAGQSLQVAKDLDPALPTAYLGLALLDRRSGGLRSLLSFRRTIQAILAAFRSPHDGGHAWANLGLLGSVSLAVLTGLFALLMLYRYGALIRHDLSERLRERLGDLGVLAATLGVLFLPLMLTVGLGWLAPYWLVLTFAYQPWKERSLSIASLVFYLLLAPLVEFHALWSRTLANPLYRASLSSVDGTFEPTHLFVIQEALAQHPEDRDLQFLLATQYKNLGEYDFSAAQYRGILGERRDDVAARVNLGNIYFAQRDWEGAILEYNRAIEARPDSGLSFYNKSLAHAENFQFREREAARARAEELDSRLVAAHERRTGDFRAVADLRLGTRDVLAKFYGLEEGLHPDREYPSWIGGWFKGRGLGFALGALFLGGLLLVLERVGNRGSTKHCWKCGTPFCRRCQIGTGRQGLCTQCYHLFISKDGVSATARNEKLSQVRNVGRSRALTFRIFSIVAPGAGHVAEDMPFIGVLLLLLWVVGAVFLLAGPELYGLPDEIMELQSALPQYAAAVVMAAAFVAANIAAQPRQRG